MPGNRWWKRVYVDPTLSPVSAIRMRLAHGIDLLQRGQNVTGAVGLALPIPNRFIYA